MLHIRECFKYEVYLYQNYDFFPSKSTFIEPGHGISTATLAISMSTEKLYFIFNFVD